MKRITPKMLKDGIPKHLETDFDNHFRMEERYDKARQLDVIRVGKKLSYLLRHNPDFVDKNGWADVSVALNKLEVDKDTLDNIVNTNDKKRYSYNDDETKIRANQGHSVNVDVELEEKIPPVVLYHGTSPQFIKSILRKGLNKMNRQHVHMSSDIETASNVGQRHSKKNKPSILSIDCKSMVKDGYKFYISANGVWLTDNIPSKYLTVCH